MFLTLLLPARANSCNSSMWSACY